MVRDVEELNIYQIAMEIGEESWVVVRNWSYFEKDTIGKQLVRSADSIALNIAEGHGRFHYKENRNFCFIARGSNAETKAALLKARNRQLINEETFTHLSQKIDRLNRMLNSYIKSIGPTSPGT